MKDIISKIVYYKTIFLGLDRWQISFYDKDNRFVNSVYCSNKDVMLEYTSCLEHFGYKEI